MPAGRKGGRKLALLESSSEDERSPAPNTRCSRSSSPGFSPGLEVLSQVQLPEAARGRKRTLVTDSSSEEEENGSGKKNANGVGAFQSRKCCWVVECNFV